MQISTLNYDAHDIFLIYKNKEYDYHYIPSSEWDYVDSKYEVFNYSLYQEFEASVLNINIEIYRYAIYYVFYV